MAEIELNGQRYLISKMNVFDQAHVARKVAPVVTGIGRGYAQAAAELVNGAGPDPSPEKQNEIFMEALMPVTEILAAMTEEDANYVMKKCISVCSRHTGQQWVPMMRSGNLMFEDTDLATIIQLVMEVVKDNLVPSLRGLMPLFSGAEESPSPSISPL